MANCKECKRNKWDTILSFWNAGDLIILYQCKYCKRVVCNDSGEDTFPNFSYDHSNDVEIEL